MTVVPGLNWTAPVDQFIGQITELDMVSAGLSVIKAEKLLPASVIKRLEALPKSKQSIAVGKLSRLPAFKTLANSVTAAIQRHVNEFLTINGVTEDRILSVKRDAVFITGPTPGRLTLPDGVKFKAKNSYTSFIKLGNIEIYAVPKREIIHVKGIPDSKLPNHKDYCCTLILDIMSLIEKGNTRIAAETLLQFRKDYIDRKLPIGFYRQFSSVSLYAIVYDKKIYQMEIGNEVSLDEIDILYNLRNVIIPLAQLMA